MKDDIFNYLKKNKYDNEWMKVMLMYMCYY